jgi:hypothetical protein
VARSESQYRRTTGESSKNLAVRCHHDARNWRLLLLRANHD